MQTTRPLVMPRQSLARFMNWMKKACCLTREESQRLKQSLTTRIIIFTAYHSHCQTPERIILGHLCTLVAALRLKQIFDHKPGETLPERLAPLASFPGGDPHVVKAGLLLLELLSLNDHKKDLADDILGNKQNPLIFQLDYESERARILKEFRALPDRVKNLFSVLFEKTVNAAWWL